MAVTLLQMVQRICRNVGLDPTLTTFSNADESNDIVQDINEAYEDLQQALPDLSTYTTAASTLTTANGTRLYSIAADAELGRLDWQSFENETDDDSRLEPTTLDVVRSFNPRYDEDTGKPRYIYAERDNQVALYPVPDAIYTIKYRYTQEPTRLTTTTDTFIFPDRWLRYIEKKAQAMYERRKGFATADTTDFMARELLGDLIVEHWATNPTYLLGDPM